MADYAKWAARWRVPLHFVAAALLLVFARPAVTWLAVGAGLVVLGLAVRAWAAGHLRREAPVTVSGPYAHLRHPLYLGSGLVVAGFAVAGGLAWLAFMLGLYFVLLFVPVLRREERQRRAAAPELYADYANRVPAFLPRLQPGQRAQPGARFDPQLYLRNREWRAALGCLGLLALLYAKMMWR